MTHIIWNLVDVEDDGSEWVQRSEAEAKLSAAVAAEREACCKAICFGCRHSLEYVNGMHKIKDGLTPKGEEFRWINCGALAIRRRGEMETTA